MRSISTLSSLINQKKNKQFSISLIEDNKFYLTAISQYIKNNIPNIKLSSFSRSSSFLSSLRHKPEIAIIDFNLDDRSEMEGIELIRELKFKSPNTQIIVLTGEKSVSTAIKCLNEGVLNYVVKEDKAADKIGKEIKKVMETMLKDIEDESRKRRINLIIISGLIIGLGFAFFKSFFPEMPF